MRNTSLINISKSEDRLKKIIKLNQNGAIIYTDKTSEALAFGCSKSEFIEAFKKDIDKTAKDITDSYGIIYSIENGLVKESKYCELATDFFGSTYSNGVVTLSGVDFFVNSNNPAPTKAEIVDSIYNEVFGITRKELAQLAKALATYEETNIRLNKAILYPSTIKVDELIEKIGLIDTKFNEFRTKMTFDEKADWNATFKRSGITDVIQNSTYISTDGIKQIAKSHSKQLDVIDTINNGIKNITFNYIEAVEIDGDGDVKKCLRVLEQVSRLKINSEHKFTFKFRKLGNLKARGVFFQGSLIVAEDVRDTSAILHEIAHFIHLSNTKIYYNEFVNYMIDKLKSRINFDNLPKDSIPFYRGKSDYYTDYKEVIARGIEIAALLAHENGKMIQSSDEFDLIKSRSFYEELEGIYFDFTSFDDETKNEMLELFKLFYETSHNEPINTNINNFVKIDTMYERKEKQIPLHKLLKQAKQESEKQRRELYSMVNGDNINMIIENRSTLALKELFVSIVSNIHFAGGYKKSQTAEEWAYTCNDRAKVVLALNTAIKSTMQLKDYILFIDEIISSDAWKPVTESVLINSFSITWRMKIRADIKKQFGENSFFNKLKEFNSSVSRTALGIATYDIRNDIDFVKPFIKNSPYIFSYLTKLDLSKEALVSYSIFFLDNFKDKRTLLNEDLLRYEEVAEKYVDTYFNSIDMLATTTSDLQNNIGFISAVINKFQHDLVSVFNYVGKELKENEEFISKFRKLVERQIEPTPTYTKKRKGKPKQEKTDDFEALIKSGEIVDFKHTETGDDLKVLKIKKKIHDFKAFNQYLSKEGIASYSKYARGFIIKNMDKVAAFTSATLYGAEALEAFANGKLF